MKNKSFLKYFVYSFISFIFLIIFVFTCFKFIKNYKIANIIKDEHSNINYNVYLKENNDFNETYYSRVNVEKNNKKFISNLIDHLDIKYYYNVKLNDDVTGYYTYFVKAILTSEQKGANFWIKEYPLTKEKTVVLDNMHEYSITDEVSVNYQDYYKILLDFKNKYNVDTDELAKFELVINSHYGNDDFDMDNANTISLDIPLNDKSTSIIINEKTSTKDNEVISNSIEEYKMYGSMALSSFIIASLFIILIINQYLMNRINTKYTSKVKEILIKYDDIIVEANGLPSLKNYYVIKVKNFSEMLDAYNNIGKPINHYQEKNKSTFTIINDKVIYVYVLKDKSQLSVK